MDFHIFILGLLFLVTTRPTTVGFIMINGIQNIDDCKLPEILSQTLTSDGVLTQILTESTSYEIASDYSSVVLKDSVAKSTKVLKVTGGDSFEISLDKNRLIFKGWSEIGTFWPTLNYIINFIFQTSIHNNNKG